MIDVTNLTITIDGVEYIGRDLDAHGQELMRHVIDVRNKRSQLMFEMAQLDVLDQAFSEALRNAVVQKEAS